MLNISQKLRDLDAYPKINEDFYKRTFSGGVVTLVSSIIILFLFSSELLSYLNTITETTLVVDTSRGGTLQINIHDIVKTRVDTHGNTIQTRRDGIGALKIQKPLQKHGGRLEGNEKYCGSCYGAPLSDDHCCNSCEDVREAYRKKGWALTNLELIDQCQREGFFQKILEEKGEGCHVNGFLEVNKVAGTFHFIPGRTFHLSDFHADDLISVQKDRFNISHRINKLTFGDYFPGVVNPLDGVQWMQENSTGSYQYFLKVVPTLYTDTSQHTILSNQFSVTEYFKNLEQGHYQSIPGVFFYYDLSPVKVNFWEKHMSFLHFMTNVCAIVGGTFTVAGFVDSFVYHGQKALKKNL